jgi:AraC-like DNA-binding protein
MKFKGKTNGSIELIYDLNDQIKTLENQKPSELFLLWFQSDNNIIEIDHRTFTFNTNDIVFLTEFHKVVISSEVNLKLLKWNKPFYCIINHDSEVSCKGVLFYGATTLPIIHTKGEEVDILKAVWKVLEYEIQSADNLQEEMLQMILKRILILCTRLYRQRMDANHSFPDFVREYHFLVEQHFKELHTVQDYADLLHKSPKTLANQFKKLGSKSPLQFIKDRKMLEARRLLAYSKQNVSEVAYELGFTDIQSFSRFFKREEGQSPVEFQRLNHEGKIDNTLGISA